jgi:hypothetical protein
MIASFDTIVAEPSSGTGRISTSPEPIRAGAQAPAASQRNRRQAGLQAVPVHVSARVSERPDGRE